MDVYIGKTSNDPRTIGKTIEWIQNPNGRKAYKCDAYSPCDILNPTIILAYDSGILAYNYAEIPIFGNRKYFIKDKSVEPGKLMYLTLAVDALETYAGGIKKSPGIITRASYLNHPTDVVDNQYPILTDKRILKNIVFKISDGMVSHFDASNSSCILTVIQDNELPS